MLDDILEKQEKSLEKEISKDYVASYKKIKEQVEGIDWQYDDEGNIKNKEDVKKLNKEIAVIVSALWLSNGKNITMASGDTIETTRLYYDFFDKLVNPKITAKLNLDKIVREQIAVRDKQIGFKSIIGGNAKTTTKRINNTILKGIKGQKTPKQVEKQVRKVLGSNGGKALSIARTEVNTHKSLAKQSSGELSTERGNIMKKTWVYTGVSMEQRPSHVAMDGETVIGIDTYFSIGTTAPQQFGVPSEDINCTCIHVVEYVTPIDFDTKEYQDFIKDY